MIKYNNNTINDWNFDTSNVIKVYRNNAVCYYKVASDSPTYDLCYAVVEDISDYQDTEFEDVYDKATEKWYKLNNLNQYEEYGVYASGRTSCDGSASRLPQGYTEVEYIENTSTAYINTEVLLYDSTTNSYEIETKMSSAWGGGEFEYLLATEGTSAPYNGLELRWNTHYQSGGELQCESVPKNVTYSNIDNGDGTSAITISCTSTNATNNVPLSIFCGIWSSGPWRNGKGKIYDLKITKNDVLVRDLAPCKRDSDDKYGMYDIVNDVFYISPNNVNLTGGDPITPTDCVTTYKGKLTIDEGYEYEWNGSSWVNLGEVTGSTASLPNVDFMLNYNARDYDSSTYSISKTEGQLKDVDAVCSYGYHIVDHSSDGYVSVTGNSRMLLSGTTYLGRNNNQTGCTMTVVSKARTTSGYSVFTNRGDTSASDMNWMWRYPSNGIFLHGSSSYKNPKYFTSTTGTPIVASIRTYYDNGLVKQQLNDWTNSGSYSGNFQYGTEYNGTSALFCDYATYNNEFWQGDFYWVYMTQSVLTDEQIQQVIDYNEGGTTSEYPKYYSEKSDPLDDLTFNTLAEAQTYAYNNCVYDGMRATINGDRYYFDSSDENGWVKILEYYKVEDVTPNAASGWTISGSSTYNPDLNYYDDFDLQTTSTSFQTKIAKVTIYGYDHFTYYLRAQNQYISSYAYAYATNIDEISSPPSSMGFNSPSAITNTYGFNRAPKSDVNLDNYRRVTFNNLDKTVEHTFYVYFYGRTYSSYVSNATILIPKEQTNENWEQVTFSTSANVASDTKTLYIDGSSSTSGGTSYFYNKWIIGLPSGSHNSEVNYNNYDYCPNVTSSTFTSVAGEQRQVNYIYDNTTNKNLSFRLVDGNGNVLTPSDTVYYNMTYYNSCGTSSGVTNTTFPRSQNVKVGGRFRFANSSNRHYIYGYSPSISLNTDYYADNYQSTFDIVYTKLNDEAVTITYTTYDPSDVEVPTFGTVITYPYNGGTTSSTTLTSFDVPYTYPYNVSQTSDKFSANSQTYTASQAARTINFTLYPNNREFATVADMEAYTYAWEGMNVTVNGTKYQYKNGEWVEQTYTQYEYIRTQNTTTIYYGFITNFKPTTANTLEVKVEFVDRSIDWGHILSWYDGTSSHGFSFQTVTGSYQAIVRTGGNKNVLYRPTIGANNPTVYTLPLSAQSGTYSVNGGSEQTIQYNYSTMVLPANIGICFFGQGTTSRGKSAVAKMYYVKVYDGNGNLVKHYVPSDNNGTPCFYEIVDGDYVMDTYTGSNHGTLTLGPEV